MLNDQTGAFASAINQIDLSLISVLSGSSANYNEIMCSQIKRPKGSYVL